MESAKAVLKLSKEEREILLKYRSLSKEGREKVMSVIGRSFEELRHCRSCEDNLAVPESHNEKP